MSKDTSKTQTILKNGVSKIIKIDHDSRMKIAQILKELTSPSNPDQPAFSQRQIASEWSAQAGKPISQTTVSQYLGALYVVEQTNANFDAVVNVLQDRKAGIKISDINTPAQAKAIVKDRNLAQAPKRKPRKTTPAKKINVVDQVKAIRKAQAQAPRLDNATRAQLIQEINNWLVALTQA
jgi:hypothetical protein